MYFVYGICSLLENKKRNISHKTYGAVVFEYLISFIKAKRILRDLITANIIHYIIVIMALFTTFSTESLARQTLIDYCYELMSVNIASMFTTTNANFNHYRIILSVNNVNANFYMSKRVCCRPDRPAEY